MLLIVRISTLFDFHYLKKFPPARLFHPVRLLDSGEYGGLQPKMTPPKHFSRECISIFAVHNMHIWAQL